VTLLWLESSLPMVRIDRNHPASLQRQIYDLIREAILGGALAPGTRIPSTRSLAAELGIARITASNAFDQLIAEGYLETRKGDGTYVGRTLPDDLLALPEDPRLGTRVRPPQLPSHRGQALERLWDQGVYQKAGLRPFQMDAPALDAFPFELWGRLESRHLDRSAAMNLAYCDPAGHPPLREAIAAHLRAHRAMACDPGQIIITHGSRQALNLAAQVLLDPGDAAWIEDPVCPDARTAFTCAGAHLVPVPVDEQGLDVAQGEALAPGARLAYVTPSHQFPLGVTLSLSRRLELLDWAFRAQAWIVEDDFDGEFRYAGKPLASLHGLDRQARVIYLGTFSRALFPGLRLGYMVVPQDLAKAFRSARALADRGSSLVPQMALTDFFNEGHFQRHLRRMRIVYGERRNVLVEAIRQSLGHLLSVRVPDSGLDLVADLEAGSGDVALVRQLARGGIKLIALSSLYQRTPSRSGLVFGFAGFPERSLRAGIGRMVELLGEPG